VGDAVLTAKGSKGAIGVGAAAGGIF
jgi:hypothetical protein